MHKNKISIERLDIIFSIVSWFLVAGLFFAAVNLFIVPPSGAGPVAGWLGVTGAQYAYSTLYSLEAIALMIAKFFKRKKFRKHVLMVIYLTGFFTSALTLLIIGVSTNIIDNLVISIGAAVCWLYWKQRTEYISHKDLDEEISALRIDVPPKT